MQRLDPRSKIDPHDNLPTDMDDELHLRSYVAFDGIWLFDSQ